MTDDDDISAEIEELGNLIEDVNKGLLSGKKTFYFLLNEVSAMLPKIYGEAQWEVTITPATIGHKFTFKSTMKPWTERLIVNDKPHRQT